MCLIFTMDNEAVANGGSTNICFAINSTLKMLFHYFYYSSINVTFVKNLMEKLLPFWRWIFQGLPKLYYLTKFCDLPTLDSKITVQYFSKFPLFLLTIWKFKANFSNFSNEAILYVITITLQSALASEVGITVAQDLVNF